MSYYIAGRDFSLIGEAPQYFGLSRGGNDQEEVGIYENPEQALTYPTSEAALHFLTHVANTGDEGRVWSLENARKDWDQRVKSGFFLGHLPKINPLINKVIPLGPDRQQNQQALLRWWLQTYQPNQTNLPAATYKANRAAFEQSFNFLNVTGIWNDTQQSCLLLRLMPVPPIEKARELLDEASVALPFIKAVAADWGEQNLPTCRFSVMEPGCSQTAAFRVETSSAGWRLAYLRHGCEGVAFSNPSGLEFFHKLVRFF